MAPVRDIADPRFPAWLGAYRRLRRRVWRDTFFGGLIITLGLWAGRLVTKSAEPGDVPWGMLIVMAAAGLFVIDATVAQVRLLGFSCPRCGSSLLGRTTCRVCKFSTRFL